MNRPALLDASFLIDLEGAADEDPARIVDAAESIDADVVAADRAAFERLGDRYLRFR